MSKMIDAYHKIIDELEKKVDDKEVVQSLKLQIQELLLEIISKARNDNEKLSKKNFFKQSTTSYSEVIFSLINRTFWSSKLKGITCPFITTPPIKPCN